MIKKQTKPIFKISKQQQQIYYGNNYVDPSVLFPHAIHFYRLGRPLQQDYSTLQALEGYLEIKKIFIDKNNPSTHKGVYISAKQFLDPKYQLFQMAASVMLRQVSRIGLGRYLQPKDIMQGQIGDCYFLSSIASLVSIYPQIISQKFIFGVNQSGMYAIRLFIDGQWRVFITDDKFPCKDGKPIFAKPHGRQIWAMLLEKCWAKVFGSYLNIQAGTPTQGFLALTGAPCQYIAADSQQAKIKVLEALEYSYKRKYVTTASGSDYLNKMSKSNQQALGLVGNHAYSVLKLLKINNQLIMKMRNPWGKQIWTGRWSFNSLQWTQQLRKQYNYRNLPDDGSFYISWSDFITYFGHFVICKIDPTLTHTSRRMTNNKRKSTYHKLNIKQNGLYHLTVYQQYKRKYQQNNYQYSPARIILMRKETGSMVYINSKNKCGYSCNIEAQLQKGTYILSTKIEWKQHQFHQSVLTCYGPQKVQIDQINHQITTQFKKSLIQSFSTKRSGKVKTYQKIKINQAYSQTYFSIEEGIGYIRVSNYSDKIFSTTLSMKDMQGLKTIKPKKLPYKFDMKPGSTDIIGFFVSSKGYSYQSSEEMQTSSK